MPAAGLSWRGGLARGTLTAHGRPRDRCGSFFEPSGYALVFFTPLQAAFFSALHLAGFDWFTAQWAFIFLGAIVIVAGIMLWLRVLFGPGPAGIGAILVGTTYFVGQGLIWIAASNVALGLGLLACGLAVAKRRRAARWIVFLCWTVVFLHVAGRGSRPPFSSPISPRSDRPGCGETGRQPPASSRR